MLLINRYSLLYESIAQINRKDNSLELKRADLRR